VGFESRPEDSYGRCRRDMIRETVPDTSSGDRKSSVTDGIDSRVRLTISDEDELERSRRRASTSATWQSSSVRYAGASDGDKTKMLTPRPRPVKKQQEYT